MTPRSKQLAQRRGLPGFPCSRHHSPQPVVDLVADQLSQQILAVSTEIIHPLPAAILEQHSQRLSTQRLRHVDSAKHACAAPLFFSSPAVGSKYPLVPRSCAGAQHAIVPSAVRNGDRIHRCSNFVFYKLSRICQLFFQFAVRAVRQHGMRQRMGLDLVPARLDFAKMWPLHVFTSTADPSCSNEKNCAQAVPLQQRQSIGMLGDMAVVEGHIWHTRTGIRGMCEFGRYLQMLFKLFCAAVIGIGLSSRSQFVINQEQRFRFRDACSSAGRSCQRHRSSESYGTT